MAAPFMYQHGNNKMSLEDRIALILGRQILELTQKGIQVEQLNAQLNDMKSNQKTDSVSDPLKPQ